MFSVPVVLVGVVPVGKGGGERPIGRAPWGETFPLNKLVVKDYFNSK